MGQDRTKLEILFRGKRADNGEWIEGCLLQTQQGTYIMEPNFPDDDLFASPRNIIHSVDIETVGQFIGLMDKNGSRIFCGDICRTEPDEYNNGATYRNLILGTKLGAYYGEVGAKDYYPLTEFFNPREVVGAWEVIGNAYDNPDLLDDE